MSRHILSKIAIFAIGAAIGSVATWYGLKTKYETLAREEIEEVRAYYSNKAENKTSLKEQYDAILNKLGYDRSEDESDKEDENVKKPYVIPPEEFGELDDYETCSLILYADGVLADDDDNPIEDVENVVGADSLNHFGEYEDDSVFVRNERFKTDYEILLSMRDFEVEDR